jgi:hypothetical protein
MNRAWVKRSVMLALAIGVVATAGAGELTIVSKVNPAKGAPYTSTQYIAAERMRMWDGDNDTIVDLEAGEIVQIDHKKKTYYETTFEEMQQYFAQLDEMLASNPMMESMMGKATEIQVNKSTTTREIVGHSCTDYVISMGTTFTETACVAPDLKMPVQYYDASKMLYAMMGPMATRFEKLLDELKKLDGFPLATDLQMKMMGIDASSSSEVTEIREGSIPADVFAIPTAYKKKKSPMAE